MVLRIKKSDVDASDLRILSPDDVAYEATEVMIKGLIEGADVLDVTDRMHLFDYFD